MYLAMRNSFWCVLIYALISHGLAAPGATSNTASLLTFNTGLVPQTLNYAQRRTETAEAIKEIDADVVCLQEVWFSDDMINILNENNAAIYPHSISDLHEDVPPAAPATAPCLNSDFLGIVFPCFLASCSQFANNGIQSLQCAIQSCDAYTVLDQQCLSCLLIAGVPNLGRCLASGVQMNGPGLLMLSKYPLTDVRITKYEALLYENGVKIFFPRAYITAEIDGIGTVACTHTTSNSSQHGYFEFGLQSFYNNWDEQSLKEMEILVDALKDETRVVIMGDLNAGPTLPQYNIAGDLEESYNYLISAGYEQTYSFTGYKCTYCVDNDIRELEDKIKGDQIIDHVLVRNIITAQFEAMRVLDENPSDPLSDHYGILAKVFKNPSSNN